MTCRRFNTATGISVENCLPHVLKQRPTPRLGGAPVVEIGKVWGALNKTKNNAQFKVVLHLRPATSLHRDLQLVGMNSSQYGVCEGVGCAKPQS